jgi:hypothetical protein
MGQVHGPDRNGNELMPSYNFRNKQTGEEFTEFVRLSELDKYLVDNPHLEQSVNTPPAIVSGIEGRLRPDQGFRDILREQKKFYKTDINTFD